MKGMVEAVRDRGQKQQAVNRIFQIVAPKYDLITVALSYGLDRHWKDHLIKLATIHPHEQILDLACGTGDITLAANNHSTTARVIGLDICIQMLSQARARAAQVSGGISFICGDMLALPFADQSFDLVTAGYALRNVPDLNAALIEIYRILKPGGRVLSLDFGKPRNRLYRALFIKYLALAGSFWGWLLHGDGDIYRYISVSLEDYPAQTGVLALMNSLGFVETGYIDFLGGAMAINYGERPKAITPQ